MPSIPIIGNLTVPKLISLVALGAFGFIFLRESYNKGLGASVGSLGTGLSSVGGAIGSFGSGFGTGFSSVLQGTLGTTIDILGKAKNLIYGPGSYSPTSAPSMGSGYTNGGYVSVKSNEVVTPNSREYSDF